MKHALIYLLISGWCITVGAQTSSEKEIATRLHQSAAAWNTGSVEKFMEDYWHSDSVMYIGKSGVTYGYDNILNNYRKSFPDTTAMGKLSFDLIHVKELSPEYVFVVGKYTVKLPNGSASGHFTLVWKKINGKWLIISDHSS